ncbi:MAG: RdgB/HAM1 family non-canonical purine NTP pyrophosphatase [Treponema sp.]|jgi:XTP/dITP diphosphohydrolase|nr:RdgB/HAM1 family non-canonical purine NTP pyrophosphatase [Treponema sp.]
MTIWFATGNEHKRQELAAILTGYTITIPSDAGIVFDPAETGSSFLENAFIKATVLFEAVHEPVIADDSGLCVDALGGGPGICSARYGGDDGGKLTPSERNALLLKDIAAAESAGRNTGNRNARFVCAMVLLLSESRFFAAQETLEGEILNEERGAGGFGYDPLLFLPEQGRTVAELSSMEKNRISHRSKAALTIGKALEAMYNR